MKRVIPALAAIAALAIPAAAYAASEYRTGFESPLFTAGEDVNGKDGWSATGQYDQEIVANGINGGQSLRLSNGYADGAFDGQTYSAPVNKAGENEADHTFFGSFRFKTTETTYQPNLSVSVSPTDRAGSRMSYLRLQDQANGTHVYFSEYKAGKFTDKDIATLGRSTAHDLQIQLLMKPGRNNDQVKVWVDGKLKVNNAATWEQYYRDNGEQAANGNLLFGVDRLIFAARGDSVPANDGNGYLFDEVRLNTNA